MRTRALTGAMRRGRRWLPLVALLAACGALRQGGGPATPPALTHGIAVGEVTDTSAVVWGRCDRTGSLHVRLGGERQAEVAVDATRDYTGRIALDDLAPNTPYAYRVWCSADGDNETGDGGGADGRFTTAPAPDSAAPCASSGAATSADRTSAATPRAATRSSP